MWDTSVCDQPSHTMKIVLLLFVVATCYALPTPDEWENYKVQFSKSYKDDAEDRMRKEIFQKNKEFVEKHNEKFKQGLVTWTAGLNKFSDWTEEEMNRLHGLKVPSS